MFVEYLLSIIICVFFMLQEVKAVDPCTNHIEINDTALTISNIPPGVTSITCPTFTPFKWYRYTGTDDGILTNQCPTGLQCGSHTQLWLNDTFPTESEGEKSAHICINNDNKCCSSKNKLTIRNCTSFIVYYFIPLPLPCTNYCFYDDKPPPVNVDTDKVNKEGNSVSDSNSWVLPVAISIPVVVVAAVVSVVVIIVLYKKHRRAAVGDEVGRNQFVRHNVD